MAKKNAEGIRTCTPSSGPPAQLVWVPVLLKIGAILIGTCFNVIDTYNLL